MLPESYICLLFSCKINVSSMATVLLSSGAPPIWYILYFYLMYLAIHSLKLFNIFKIVAILGVSFYFNFNEISISFAFFFKNK